MHMPYRARERALIAQTMIDLVKIVRRGRLGNVYSIDTLLVSAAIVVGDAAGKPKTASEIGALLDLPRVTVLRKLSRLVSAGLAEKKGTRYYMMPVPPDARYIEQALTVIRRAKNL
jgi:hypothetical protein